MYSKLNQLLYFSLLILLIDACNFGAEHPPDKMSLTNQPTSAALRHKDPTSNDSLWAIDNVVSGRGLNATLKDLGWHLITLTYTPEGKPSHPIKVEGLIAGIYPAPRVNVGQQVIIRDLNCNTAIFSKVGDSCSAYFRLSYDTSKSINGPIDFPIQIAPKGDLAALLIASPGIEPFLSSADYRVVKANEDQYYKGVEVAHNKPAYQILLVQNGSLAPFQLTQIPIPHNPTFTLQHRTNNLESDPYYGPAAECSLNERPELKQVNRLTNLNQQCILIYQAAATAANKVERDVVKISSDADYFFPERADKYLLKANYSAGTPIPDEPINSLHAKLLVPYPVKSFMLNYNFQPKPLPLRGGSSGSTLVLAPGAEIWLNEPILTNLNTPATVSSISDQYPEASVVAGNDISVTACGGAHTEARGTVTIYDRWTRQGLVAIHQDINSSGNCGGAAPFTFDAQIPLSGFDQIIYHVDHPGCEGGNWDIGGTVRLYGGCSNGECNYAIDVNAHHGGVGGQCHDDQTRTINFSFADPSNMLAQLSPANPQLISFAAQGGQSATGSIGSESGQFEQTINCGPTGVCAVNASYRSWPGGQDLSYAINLNPEDIFGNGAIEFTRSSGYDFDSLELKPSELQGLDKANEYNEKLSN